MTDNILGMDQAEFDRLTLLYKIQPVKEKPVTKASIKRDIANLKIQIEIKLIDGNIFDSVKDDEKEIARLKFKLRMLSNSTQVVNTSGLTPQQIERAREVDISNFIRVNSAKKALCIFHSERNPSMHIYKNKYYCFTCGAHGSTIDIVMQLYNLSFTETVKKIIN